MNKKLLSPLERFSEIFFGLIMVLTFTSTMSVLEAGRTDVRQMLLLALGCNFAWGIIDAVFYLIGVYVEKSRQRLLLLQIKNHANSPQARSLLKSELPAEVATVLNDQACDAILQSYLEQLARHEKFFLKREDYLAALGVFALVFFSTLPVVVPFLIFKDPWTALRVSNLIAVVSLFVAGDRLAQYTSASRWKAGLFSVGLGVALVSLAISFGG